LNFCEGEFVDFSGGSEFIMEDHPYAYDLDIFGPKSLFWLLNRTNTVAGKRMLADLISHRQPDPVIISNQNSIAELNNKLDFRQEFTAHAKLADDSESRFKQLNNWSQSDPGSIGLFTKIFSWILPAVFVALLAVAIYSQSFLWVQIAVMSFLLNLAFMIFQIKKIKQAQGDLERIQSALERYSQLISLVEKENFTTAGLKTCQKKFSESGKSASAEIKQLAVLFKNLESMQNLFGALLFNGTVLFHFHVFSHLNSWRKKNIGNITEWLLAIGEMEALISLSNFSFNHPDYCFPLISFNSKPTFTELGHPLIKASGRISNSISFQENRFVVLTGSNMSGKSTFLRTLGVNMVLANCGAPVCAQNASLQPLDVLVSMRLSDSLNDNESYFFAEVNKLKFIMDSLQSGTAFVLLDEILRGTNSDDKRFGTVEVLRKMVESNAIGALATHDLEVCNTTDEYPAVLSNKCFEVEIKNNELVFDYKLRSGICKNKSATFLMKKLGVI
jgi:DNA mismatch repair ATPase MutS